MKCSGVQLTLNRGSKPVTTNGLPLAQSSLNKSYERSSCLNWGIRWVGKGPISASRTTSLSRSGISTSPGREGPESGAARSSSISLITVSSSDLQNRVMGEKSFAWCSFRLVQARKNGFLRECFSRRACSSKTSASSAPLLSVRTLTCSKHSAHASRPQRRHIQLLEKIEVMQVSAFRSTDRQ